MDMYEASKSHPLHPDNIRDEDHFEPEELNRATLTNGSLMLRIIDETINHIQGTPFDSFVIDNDEKAEWGLKKIAEETAETNRYIAVCEKMAFEYSAKIEKAQKQLQDRTKYLKAQLHAYFQRVQHKATKTQETYRLPSGVLKLKLPKPEMVWDESKLISWISTMKLEDFIVTSSKVKWGEFKKQLATNNGNAIYIETGEIVDGITVIDCPPVFDIELKA